MKKSLIIFTVLFSVSLFAQQMGGGFSVAAVKEKLDLTRGYESSEMEISGKPYFTETFLPASVDGYEGFFLLRYNAARDEMEFEKDGKLLYIVKENNLHITFANSKKQYYFLDYNTEKESDIQGFLVLLKDDKNVSLYKKESIKLVPKKEASNPYASDIPAYYDVEKDLFFIKKDNAIKPFPKNKKELTRMFPNKEKEISTFLKSSGVSFSKENDLVKLTTFLNTI